MNADWGELWIEKVNGEDLIDEVLNRRVFGDLNRYHLVPLACVHPRSSAF
jgi:hypothetical protein